MNTLDFEKPIAELENKIEGLKHLVEDDGIKISEEVSRLQTKLNKLLKSIYTKLTPWQKAQIARHPARPHCKDYIKALIEDFVPLAGDRCFADDMAMVGGIGRFRGHSVVVLGQEKGNDTESRVKYNFGMAKPEGYRKAQRLMDLANRFSIPVLTFVDTAGAYPGVEAEARGQSEAIARCIETCFSLKVPVISCIIGEGGSGGAIAIAGANAVLMLEHSIYSVISPEGCASILWRSSENTKDAAEALKMTAQDLKELGIIDEIIKEPLGGAHRDPEAAIQAVGDTVYKYLEKFIDVKGGMLKTRRRDKFLQIGRLS
ncbi:MAG: acetyl-CoA carboxylase carboxyltransferase subunit alpha [Alphaproteobacteria bacterium]